MQQERHEHRRADHLAPHMAARELRAAVAAPPAGGEIAHHRNKVPRAEHMAARVAVRPPAQHALAMHHAPRHAVQETPHAGAEQRGERAAVYGEEGGEMEHRKIPPWKKSFVGDGRRPSATPLFLSIAPKMSPLQNRLIQEGRGRSHAGACAPARAQKCKFRARSLYHSDNSQV